MNFERFFTSITVAYGLLLILIVLFTGIVLLTSKKK